MTIVNDASTINVIDDASLAIASIVNYDCKWCYNLECHFDDTRSVNYDHNTFIIQATGCQWYSDTSPLVFPARVLVHIKTFHPSPIFVSKIMLLVNWGPFSQEYLPFLLHPQWNIRLVWKFFQETNTQNYLSEQSLTKEKVYNIDPSLTKTQESKPLMF